MTMQTEEIVVTFGDILHTIVTACKSTSVKLLCTLIKSYFLCYIMMIDDDNMLIVLLTIGTDIDLSLI